MGGAFCVGKAAKQQQLSFWPSRRRANHKVRGSNVTTNPAAGRRRTTTTVLLRCRAVQRHMIDSPAPASTEAALKRSAAGVGVLVVLPSAVVLHLFLYST